MENIDKLRKAYPWPPYSKLTNLPDFRRGNVVKGLNHIIDLIKDIKHPIILEVGSEFGGGARTFIEKLNNPTVICIDKWPVTKYGNMNNTIKKYTINSKYGTWSIFSNLCEKYKDNIICLRGDRLKKIKMVHKFGVNPDLIYVDCNHTYKHVLEDLELCYSLFPQSILCGDDWRSNKKKGYPLQKAVKEFASKHELEIEIFDNQYHLYTACDSENL